MANRFPLVIDQSTNRIAELPVNDNLDMTNNGIVNLQISNLKVSGGSTGQVIVTDGQGNLSFGTASVQPAGSNTQVQFNDNGALGANSTFTFNKTTNTLTSENITSDNSVLKKFNESVVDGGNTGTSTLAPNASTGTIYRYTATGNFTLNNLTNAVAGTSMTIIITQDGAGNKTMSSTMKFLGGSKTLSTAANSIDIISIFFDGTTYYASLTKDYK